MPEYKGDGEDEYLHLIVMSGINDEGQNIIFAVAVVQQITYETFCWLLFQFKQANMTKEPIIQSSTAPNDQCQEDDVHFTEPETILSTFQQGISQAISIIFSYRVTHIYCQNSMKQFIRE